VKKPTLLQTKYFFMNKTILKLSLVALISVLGCNKDDKCSSGNTCFECSNCQGQYGHLINGEYCVDGYDNCKDWEAAKTNYENNDGCTCQFTK